MEDFLRTGAGGYRIRAGLESLDLLEFRRLTAAAGGEAGRGAHHAAAASLDEAVAVAAAGAGQCQLGRAATGHGAALVSEH